MEANLPPVSDGPPRALDWFVAIDEKQTGPLTPEAIKEHWDRGEIGPDSLTWRQGFEDWVPLSEVSELAAWLAPRPQRPVFSSRLGPDAGRAGAGRVGLQRRGGDAHRALRGADPGARHRRLEAVRVGRAGQPGEGRDRGAQQAGRSSTCARADRLPARAARGAASHRGDPCGERERASRSLRGADAGDRGRAPADLHPGLSLLDAPGEAAGQQGRAHRRSAWRSWWCWRRWAVVAGTCSSARRPPSSPLARRLRSEPPRATPPPVEPPKVAQQPAQATAAPHRPPPPPYARR